MINNATRNFLATDFGYILLLVATIGDLLVPFFLAPFSGKYNHLTMVMSLLGNPNHNYYAEYVTIQTEPSEAQKQMVQALAECSEKIRKDKIDPSIDNMLKITSDGRKLALDQRILNPLLPDDPGSKVNACVENVFKIWEESTPTKGAQLIFSDLSTPKGKTEKKKEKSGKEEENGDANENEEDLETDMLESSVYEDIKKKLIAKGIPEKEIAFIHDAHTETQKAELFAKVRNGQVRVLLGSTQKMGAGTNAQKRLVASHDLDCP